MGTKIYPTPITMNQTTPLTCKDFPTETGQFQATECVDDDYTRYCRPFEEQKICLTAINTGYLTKIERKNRTWILKGYVHLENDIAAPIDLKGAETLGFSEQQAVETTQHILKTLNQKDALQETVQNAAKRAT